MSLERIYNVGDISSLIGNNFNFPEVYKIKGELSGYSKRGNNIYATIKDKDSTIDIISWNNDDDFQNGDEIIINGKINHYKKTNRINIIAYKIEKKGLGDLFKKYLQFKNEYESKGYFNKDNKKHIPECINNIAIVTSADGAALRDILYVLKENKFRGKIYLKDCMVQGNSAGKSVGDAVNLFNNKYKNKIDLIMITRGGGSFEDLFPFSSSEVINALHSSTIFTISAVGHETDNMLSDFTADYRAPTPSIGAQLISNIYLNKFDMIKKGAQQKIFIKNLIKSKIELMKSKLNFIKTFDVLDKVIHELKNNKIIIKNNIKYKQYEIKNRINKLKDKIGFLEEKDKILYEGYSMIIDPETEKTITSIDEIGYDFILVIKNKKYLVKPASIINYELNII